MSRRALLAGVRDAAPAVPPNVPFGMIFGATAVAVGFDPAQATAMSVFIFAGAAQLAAVELLQADAVLPVVLLTAFVLNLRYVVYSASLASMVRELPLRWRAVMGYGLFDINYALAAARFRDGSGSAGPSADLHRGWYYLGATLPLVAALAVGTLAGALLGRATGADLGLSFLVPLVFVALVVPMLGDRPSRLTAVVAGAVSVVGAGLPLNLGLLVAAAAGVGAGLLHRRVGREGEPR